ncbi:MAG: hypothetical protein IJ496_04120 [Ruminococcus sp.]|nr:hypothetical protein [Ruminococcus sp.]
MKKQITALALASMLMLAGCTPEKEDTSSIAAVTWVTTASTQPEIYINEVQIEYFQSYDELMAAYKESNPTSYVHPLPDIVSTWEERRHSLSTGNYTVRYTDPSNQVRVMLEISFNSAYNTIENYINQPVYAYEESEIVEMTDKYAVKHYITDDDYAIIGITGDLNIMYTLVVRTDDETLDPVELHKQYMEILEL